MKKLLFLILIPLLCLCHAPVRAGTNYYVNPDCTYGAGCDGSDMAHGDVSLSNAVTDPLAFLALADGTLYVKTGTYDAINTFNFNDRQTIQAADANGNPVNSGVTLKLKSGQASIVNFVCANINRIGTRTIRGITFDSNGVSPTTALITIGAAYAVNQASKVVLDHCTFVAASGTPLTKPLIKLTSNYAVDVSITNSTFTGVYFDGTAGNDFFTSNRVGDFVFDSNTVTVRNDNSKVMLLSSSTITPNVTITNNEINSAETVSANSHFIYHSSGGLGALTISNNIMHMSNPSNASGMIEDEGVGVTGSLLMENNTITDDGKTIRTSRNYPVAIYPKGGKCTSANIRNNTIKSNTQDSYVVCLSSEGSNANYNNNFDGLIFEKNKVIGPYNYDSSSSLGVHGIMLGYNENIKFRYNYIDGCPLGMQVKSTNTITTNAEIYDNVFVNFGNSPGMSAIIVAGAAGAKVYNNTLYSPYSTPGTGIRIAVNPAVSNEPATGALVRNNIVYMKDGTALASVEAACTATFDHNCYWNDAGTGFDFTIGASPVSWDTWTETYDKTGSATKDPEFADPANSKFWLKPSSPCKHAGSNLYQVGSTYHYGIDKLSIFPTDVRLKKQGVLWSMGAYPMRLNLCQFLGYPQD